MTAVATPIFAIPRLSRRARVALLTVHVAVSVGWLGLDGALVALEVTGLSAGDPVVQGGIATAMGALAAWVLIPVVFVSLVSGLVLALSTPWGLVRHWWVLAKCAITMVLTATGLLLMLPRLGQIAAGDGEPVQLQSLLARSLALVLLLAATGLSVVKPWGKTPWGKTPWGQTTRGQTTRGQKQAAGKRVQQK
ncbi:MAG: hypothetical protein ACRDSR_10790 [Pseudonocardiaceae bacterium]